MNERKPCPFCGNEIIDGQASDHKEDCFMLMVTVLCPPYLVEEIQKAWDTRVSGWISVKDGLPEDGELVLACNIGKPTYFAFYSKGDFLDIMDAEILTKYVTHWQPLPKPMKES